MRRGRKKTDKNSNIGVNACECSKPANNLKAPKAKIEFSKVWLVSCITISLICTAMSYVLAWFDKNTVETLSIAVVEALWGASGVSFFGYVIQNSARAYTASRFGIPQQSNEGCRKEDNNEH